MDSLVKETIIQALSELPVCDVSSNGIQYTVRCPYCGDSKNPSHAHLSIRIDPLDPLDPMLFNCLKCPASGIVTADVLRDLQVTLSTDIENAMNKLVRVSCRTHKITMMKFEDVTVPLPIIDESNKKKLDYINNRLGISITPDECRDYGIILNVSEFIELNNVPIYVGTQCSDKMLWFLSACYVGFLSKNRNIITMRYVDGIINTSNLKFPPKRYIKAKVNPKNYDLNSYYSIPNKIDILYTEDINIHLAEGTFDILSIYYNCMNCNLDNNYYYAVCGFGYAPVLRSIVSLGLNTGLIVHIYADADKTDEEIVNKLNKSGMMIWIKHLYIHRNGSGQKDYGVKKSMIQDTKRKIK